MPNFSSLRTTGSSLSATKNATKTKVSAYLSDRTAEPSAKAVKTPTVTMNPDLKLNFMGLVLLLCRVPAYLRGGGFVVVDRAGSQL